MTNYKRPEDRWKGLREELQLYGNVEPEVTLEAVTLPLVVRTGWQGKAKYHADGERKWRENQFEEIEDIMGEVDWHKVEMLPALSASVSYGSTDKIENDYDRCVALNKSLISKHHETPFESVMYNFHIKGLSKAAGAQLSRYRAGTGHISASRRFRTAEPQFVYPLLDSMEEVAARSALYELSVVYRDSYAVYEQLRKRGLKKEDSRMTIPVASAGERTMWINARSLRHVFQERLREDCESELRRLVWLIWDLVYSLAPSFYSDIAEEIKQSSYVPSPLFGGPPVEANLGNRMLYSEYPISETGETKC